MAVRDHVKKSACSRPFASRSGALRRARFGGSSR